ncbi:MAG: carbamoyl transferase [Chloroflexi bacterium]|nr:carbamoyl transferase [Chloroflexota bacterium]
MDKKFAIINRDKIMKKKLNILGVANANVSGAALIIGDKTVSAISEERLSRKKNDRCFPINSINYVLSNSNLDISDIDFICCGCWKGLDVPEYVETVVKDAITYFKNDPASEKIVIDKIRVSAERDEFFKNELVDGLTNMGFDSSKIFMYDHHTSHAYTAFYASQFEESLVFTLDGRGDFKSGTVWLASRDSGLQLIDSINMLDSLGVFYGYITKFLGFKPNRHEGKILGLAARGNYETVLPIVSRMINYENGRLIGKIGDNFTAWNTGSIPSIENELKTHSREDIAAATQYWLEELTLKYITPIVQKYNIKNISLAGGVFANVVLNQRLIEIDGVENIYVFPHMGDGGNALGGAMIKAVEEGVNLEYPMKDAYLGPSFDNSEIESVLEKHSKELYYENVSNQKMKLAAELIHEGKIVGWFQGRMEYGPRALGTRSILARATDSSINDSLNNRLSRTEFMPFAPVTMKEHAKAYYIDWKPEHFCSNFMTITYNCTDLAKSKTPATVHVDGTARPQIIDKGTNPEYYGVVEEYYKISGIPSIINTSFNNHEEPILCKPEDAVRSILLRNVDVMFIGDFLVKVNE